MSGNRLKSKKHYTSAARLLVLAALISTAFCGAARSGTTCPDTGNPIITGQPTDIWAHDLNLGEMPVGEYTVTIDISHDGTPVPPTHTANVTEVGDIKLLDGYIFNFTGTYCFDIEIDPLTTGAYSDLVPEINDQNTTTNNNVLTNVCIGAHDPKPDLRPTAISFPACPATGVPLAIVVTITNSGETSTIDSYTVTLYADGSPVGSVTESGVIAVNGTKDTTFNWTPVAAAYTSHTLTAQVVYNNTGSNVGECNLANNTTSDNDTSENIFLHPSLPDLVPTEFDFYPESATAYVGNDVVVRARINNYGGVDAVNGFGVFTSSPMSSAWPSSAPDVVIPKCGAYVFTAPSNFHCDSAGTYIVQVDGQLTAGSVDYDSSNNQLAAGVTCVPYENWDLAAYSPPDVVFTPDNKDQINVGETLPITVTIHNNGPNTYPKGSAQLSAYDLSSWYTLPDDTIPDITDAFRVIPIDQDILPGGSWTTQVFNWTAAAPDNEWHTLKFIIDMHADDMDHSNNMVTRSIRVGNITGDLCLTINSPVAGQVFASGLDTEIHIQVTDCNGTVLGPADLNSLVLTFYDQTSYIGETKLIPVDYDNVIFRDGEFIYYWQMCASATGLPQAGDSVTIEAVAERNLYGSTLSDQNQVDVTIEYPVFHLTSSTAGPLYTGDLADLSAYLTLDGSPVNGEKVQFVKSENPVGMGTGFVLDYDLGGGITETGGGTQGDGYAKATLAAGAVSGTVTVTATLADQASACRLSDSISLEVIQGPDTIAPVALISSPAAGSLQTAQFKVDVANSDTGGSGLDTCYYHVLSNGVETKPWSSYDCADPLITVGPDSSNDCHDQGANICQVEVYATDNAGNTSATDSRAFSISWDTCPGFVVTSADDTGNGSLRSCITEANSASGAQTITFDSSLVGQTITLASALPVINDTTGGTTITNTTGGEITVNGNGGDYSCFTIQSSNNAISGMTIVKCGTYGSQFNGAIVLDSSSATANTISGNYIGTNITSESSLGNRIGININGGATDNLVGGTTAGERNVISGNTTGIYIYGSGTDGNIIRGNYIGTNAAGDSGLGNSQGINISEGAKTNIIGGTTAGERNVISGNNDGIYVVNNGTDENVIKGNYIGTNAAGNSSLSNTEGIYIGDGSKNNIIGGTTEGERNVISGNSIYGIILYGNGTDGNVIKGNYIGTNAGGDTAVKNTPHGVYIASGPKNNVVGGTTAGERNVISGNYDGIFIEGSDENVIKGNYIGTNANADTAVENSHSGIYIFSSSSNIIGGTTAGERNVISGNGTGIFITDVSDGNMIKGNYIGTNADGDTAVGNYYGVYIVFGSKSNIIGGTTDGERNVISGNYDGVYVANNGTDGNMIKGNYIGTNANGDTAVGNYYGVFMVFGSKSNVVGGTSAGERNVISGNKYYGIRISGDGTDGNIVKGNYIGTDATGVNGLGNDIYGVIIAENAINNVIGGLATGEENIIAFNGGTSASNPGIVISGAATSNNKVSGNRIFSNDGIGIDLVDSANNSIVAPVITGVTESGTDYYNVAVTISSVPTGECSAANPCTIEVFSVDDPASSVTADPSGAGEGFAFSGYLSVDSCGTTFPCNVTVPILQASVNSGSTLLTATITDSTGNTSEFATNYSLPVIAPTCPGWLVTTNADSGDGSLRSCITEANSASGAQTITFDSSLVGQTITLASALPALSDTTGGTTITNTTGGEIIISGNSVVSDCFIIQSANNGVSGMTIVKCTDAAVLIDGSSATDNRVSGNYIGTNTGNSSSLGNKYGVYITNGAYGNIIGGTTSGERNIISANTNYEIYITGSGTDGNHVSGNYIGIDNTGGVALSSGGGVYINNGAKGNIIGGTSVAERNIVGKGISIAGSGTENNIVSGNYIGINATGDSSLGIGGGVYISTDAMSNTIGGTTEGERNVISGNTRYGIAISSNSNIIIGNYIGTDATGLINIGNGTYGITVNSGTNNIIGGHGTGEGNLVAFNGGTSIYNPGVRVGGTYNKVSGNRIFSNAGLGIDILAGANGNIASPVITGVTTSGLNYDIAVTVNSVPTGECSVANPCTIEIFSVDDPASSVTADPSGAGEGFAFSGYLSVDSCGTTFPCNVTVTIPQASVNSGSTLLTATITDSTGSTSEFATNYAKP